MTSNRSTPPIDEIRARQDRRVAYTVEYAWEQSPFYREHMESAGVVPDDINSVDDLSKLPVVDGDDILANQPPETETFVFRNDDANIRRQFHTSGTTGTPKTVFKSYDEVEAIFEDVAEGHAHLGVSASDIVVDYLPFVGLNVSCFGTEGGLAELGAETIPISNTPYPPDVEADILQRREPDVVEGLASHIDAKGQRLLDVGVDPASLGIELVVLVGEPVSDARKQRIQEAYDAPVREYYGCTEAGAFAWECHEHDGLHILEESVYVEVVNPDNGDSLPAGECGSLVVTNLLAPGAESGMPLIRYELGDRVEMSEWGVACDCSLASGRRLVQHYRENQQFIVGAVNLTTQFIEEQLYRHGELGPAVEEYQIIVEYEEETGRDCMTIMVVAEDIASMSAEDIAMEDSSETVVADFGQQLLASNSHLADTVETVDAARLDVEIVDELSMGEGKPQRLVDKREDRK